MEEQHQKTQDEQAADVLRRMNSSRKGEMSYAKNSRFQEEIASATKAARQEMAAALYRSRGRPAAMAIADLGCATGPNALLMASDAVEAVLAECARLKQPPPELHIFLNDLPANDFNAIFRLLPSSPLAAGGCFVSAWPGSFYGRIFPEASLDYVVSSSSLHFLSKAPKLLSINDGGASSIDDLNQGRLYISQRSPRTVLDAYRAQFQSDFTSFLSCRAAEMKPRGVVLLTFVARRTPLPTAHDCYLWDLLADALMDMAAAGLVDEGKVHSFNAPYYGPCPSDLAEVIGEEGSFAIRVMQLFETTRRRHILSAGHPAYIDAATDEEEEEELPRKLALETASTIRAVVEPILRTHFGSRGSMMDSLFCKYRFLLEAYYGSKSTKNKDDLTSVFLALEKKDH